MNFKVAVVAASMLFALGANAGPFGIDPGDPINVEGISDEGLIFEKLKAGNFGGFEEVVKYGTQETGTCMIVAFKHVWDRDAGLLVQDFFHRTADRLIEKYGDPTTRKDAIEADSIWTKNHFWMHSLALGERELAFTWLPCQ